MGESEVIQDIRDLYTDLSACFLTLANALEHAGVVSKSQIAEAAQERLLSLQLLAASEKKPLHPLFLLRTLAVDLVSTSES